MKKVLAFAAFALILAACSNAGKYKASVDEVSKKWDSTSSAAAEFAGNVKTEQTNWMNAKASMATPSPEAMAKWDEATKTKYNEAQTAWMNAESGLTGMASEVDQFLNGWQTKASELQALKDGVAAGKLEGKPDETINSLNTAITDAETKLESWKKSLNDWKTSAENSKKMMADFMATQPAPNAKPGGTK